MKACKKKKSNKVLDVAFTYTSAQPGTVMVLKFDTNVAVRAVE